MATCSTKQHRVNFESLLFVYGREELMAALLSAGISCIAQVANKYLTYF